MAAKAPIESAAADLKHAVSPSDETKAQLALLLASVTQLTQTVNALSQKVNLGDLPQKMANAADAVTTASKTSTDFSLTLSNVGMMFGGAMGVAAVYKLIRSQLPRLGLKRESGKKVETALGGFMFLLSIPLVAVGFTEWKEAWNGARSVASAIGALYTCLRMVDFLDIIPEGLKSGVKSVRNGMNKRLDEMPETSEGWFSKNKCQICQLPHGDGNWVQLWHDLDIGCGAREFKLHMTVPDSTVGSVIEELCERFSAVRAGAIASARQAYTAGAAREQEKQVPKDDGCVDKIIRKMWSLNLPRHSDEKQEVWYARLVENVRHAQMLQVEKLVGKDGDWTALRGLESEKTFVAKFLMLDRTKRALRLPIAWRQLFADPRAITVYLIACIFVMAWLHSVYIKKGRKGVKKSTTDSKRPKWRREAEGSDSDVEPEGGDDLEKKKILALRAKREIAKKGKLQCCWDCFTLESEETYDMECDASFPKKCCPDCDYQKEGWRDTRRQARSARMSIRRKHGGGSHPAARLGQDIVGAYDSGHIDADTFLFFAQELERRGNTQQGLHELRAELQEELQGYGDDQQDGDGGARRHKTDPNSKFDRNVSNLKKSKPSLNFDGEDESAHGLPVRYATDAENYSLGVAFDGVFVQGGVVHNPGLLIMNEHSFEMNNPKVVEVITKDGRRWPIPLDLIYHSKQMDIAIIDVRPASEKGSPLNIPGASFAIPKQGEQRGFMFGRFGLDCKTFFGDVKVTVENDVIAKHSGVYTAPGYCGWGVWSDDGRRCFGIHCAGGPKKRKPTDGINFFIPFSIAMQGEIKTAEAMFREKRKAILADERAIKQQATLDVIAKNSEKSVAAATANVAKRPFAKVKEAVRTAAVGNWRKVQREQRTNAMPPAWCGATGFQSYAEIKAHSAKCDKCGEIYTKRTHAIEQTGKRYAQMTDAEKKALPREANVGPRTMMCGAVIPHGQWNLHRRGCKTCLDDLSTRYASKRQHRKEEREASSAEKKSEPPAAKQKTAAQYSKGLDFLSQMGMAAARPPNS